MKPDLTLAVPPVSGFGRVHFVGIGGAGMSGLARIMLARGLPVSGSDARDSPVLAALAGLGATVHVGHAAAHLGGADIVVVSSAVREDNPELVAARAAGMPILHRAHALAAVMAGRLAVAVAGTAGKTTTTAMITSILRWAGLDPSFAIGGDLIEEGGINAHAGQGDVFVAEADESDGSFLLYEPLVAVITNVEPDHLDHYGTPDAVEAAFVAFCARVARGGLVVACGDDPGAQRVCRAAGDRLSARGVTIVRYGHEASNDLRVLDLRSGPDGAQGLLLPAAGGEPRSLRVGQPGVHNVLNAAAAWRVATWLGVPADVAAAGLAAFAGTRRRFELRGRVGGIAVIDDYAHHPSKVRAVLEAARTAAGAGRVLAVFQPHLFSRTRIFATEFGAALGLADEVAVLDVYAAREDPEPGVSGRLVAERVPLPPGRVHFLPDPADAVGWASGRARPGDLVLTIGAGDVTEIGPQILAALGRVRA